MANGLDQTGAQNFQQSAYINPFSGLQDVFRGLTADRVEAQKAAALEQHRKDILAQQALDNKRADAQLQLSQNQDTRAADAVTQANLQKKLAQDLASTYRPYAGQDTPVLDTAVVNNLAQLTPKDVGMIPVAPGSTQVMPAVDEEVYKKQEALQAMYEKVTPTQEKAYSDITSKAIAAGLNVKDAGTLGTTLSTGLQSDAALQKQYQESADAQNKLNQWGAGEKNKFSIADIKKFNKADKDYTTKATASGGSAMNAINKLSASEIFGGDKEDAFTTVTEAAKVARTQKMPEKNIDRLMGAAVTYAAGSTDWTDGKAVEFSETRFNNFIEANQNNPMYTGAKGGSGYAPVVPERVTAGQYEFAAKQAKELDQKRQLDAIFGTPKGVTGSADTAADSTKDVKIQGVVNDVKNELVTKYGKDTLEGKGIVNILSREGLLDTVKTDGKGISGGFSHRLSPQELLLYPKGTKVPYDVARKWLDQDTSKAFTAAKSQANALEVAPNSPLAVALAGVNFQLGSEWNKDHTKTWELLKNKEYDKAIEEVRNSDWNKQTKVRVDDFVNAIKEQKGYKGDGAAPKTASTIVPASFFEGIPKAVPIVKDEYGRVRAKSPDVVTGQGYKELLAAIFPSTTDLNEERTNSTIPNTNTIQQPEVAKQSDLPPTTKQQMAIDSKSKYMSDEAKMRTNMQDSLIEGAVNGILTSSLPFKSKVTQIQKLGKTKQQAELLVSAFK